VSSFQHGPQTPSHFHLQLYEEHKTINTILGGTGLLESPQRKQIQIECHSTKSECSPQNTSGRNTKTLKILHIICILLATSVRKNWNVQAEMNAVKQEATTCTWHS
jgi:hypothetical protein